MATGRVRGGIAPDPGSTPQGRLTTSATYPLSQSSQERWSMLADCPEVKGRAMPYTAQNWSHASLSEQKTVPYWAAGSQQLMTRSRQVEDTTLHGVGAQFDAHQVAHADLTGDVDSHKEPHGRHQDQVPRVDMSSRGIVQAHGYSGPSPMERFLMETLSQQPALFFESLEGHLSSRHDANFAPHLSKSNGGHQTR